MKRRRTALITTVVIAMMFVATACQPQTDTSPNGDSGSVEIVKVGAIYPMTGAAAQTGKEYIDAIQLAVDIVNNEYDLDLPFARGEGIPGLDGAKIEITVADHQASPEVGLSEAERLISEEKVHMLMGCHYSSVSKTATNVAERSGIPFVIPDSTSKDLTERGYQYVFRTGPHDGTFVHDTFKYLDYLNDDYNAGIRTVAMVAEDTEFGALLANEVENLHAEYGYDLVENITYPADSINVTPEVLKLKAAAPDAVIMASYTSDAILFIKTYQEQGFLPKAIIGQRAGFIAPELFAALGNLTEGIATTNLWALDLSEANPLVATVNDLFVERSGVDFTGDYIRAFTAVFVIADALDRAGSVDPDAIRQALVETDIVNEGQLMVPWEGVKFDENGQNIYASGIITQAFDKAYKTVWPSDNKSIEPVVPMLDWNAR
jgi:branched-chain amino acid transport system substrate-binding protein